MKPSVIAYLLLVHLTLGIFGGIALANYVLPDLIPGSGVPYTTLPGE